MAENYSRGMEECSEGGRGSVRVVKTSEKRRLRWIIRKKDCKWNKKIFVYNKQKIQKKIKRHTCLSLFDIITKSI